MGAVALRRSPSNSGGGQEVFASSPLGIDQALIPVAEVGPARMCQQNLEDSILDATHQQSVACPATIVPPKGPRGRAADFAVIDFSPAPPGIPPEFFRQSSGGWPRAFRCGGMPMAGPGGGVSAG